MAKNYLTEREGQIAFFNNFRIDYENNPVLIDNTDGVWKGNILEFKLNITNLNKVVFQTIKYLSKMRIKGESIPANILIVDLNQEICYVYHSQDYFEDIHKVYIGGASTNNENFTAGNYREKIDYSTQEGSLRVLQLLQEKNYMKIKIDENCIVGWAERYYREHPHANKGDFLGDETGKIKVKGEIREPKHFKDYILPFEDTTNERFKYLMGVLNDRLSKKDLGAFYTPMAYVKKACELVKMAIDRVPEGNDYIILDRCCGTGNLEQAILDELGEEVASHIICSTYEYYEYKVLVERLGDKVRTIIPPTEDNVLYSNGCILNADAMSEDYVNNSLIKSYVDNPNCTIILFENPPYRDAVADNSKKSNTNMVDNYVITNFKKILSTLPNSNISTVRDLSNQLIWSGNEYYQRQPHDRYILFSPIKYWKSLGLMNKVFIKGYLFNREHFNATASSISCILWQNQIDNATEEICLEAYDIDEDKELKYIKEIVCKKCHLSLNKLMKLGHDKDDIEGAVYCESNGKQTTGRKCDGKSYWNDNIVGYLNATGFSVDPKHTSLLRSTYFGIRGGYIRTTNYLKQLPLFVAKSFPQDKWFERDIYFNTADKGIIYQDDAELLKSCLIWTCLTSQNKCLSFQGTDGRMYRNELCFDNGTVATKDLYTFSLTQEEKYLLSLWHKINQEIRTYHEYNPKYTSGTYQIDTEINTWTEITTGRKKEKRYNHPELNGDLNTLRVKLKEYYKQYITPKLFEYELLK